ncbi:S1C family serine protease [Corynebacterium heidelbergense]|uniref:Serine protease n=1 Tax=Corynebacterium heidelbergense TaxID=2055947 RepID=A0A364V6B9_9CORY|nr:trypsin-like peptidase domain-containing protein [Corynebacterium heidelbergense]RAV32154.1 serine protease [Corynebacterium heidelbergense]
MANGHGGSWGPGTHNGNTHGGSVPAGQPNTPTGPHPGAQETATMPVGPGGVAGAGAYGNPGYAGGAGPNQPYPGAAVAPSAPKSRRWSTPVVALLMAGTAVLATVGTNLAMESAGTKNVSSSFDRPLPAGDQRPPQAGSVEEVSSRVLPSVVSIQASGLRGGAEGSGSILTSDGMIMTNNHVIGDAGSRGEINVTFNDGSTLPAKLVATDPQTDIAVIKAVGAKDLTPMALGNSDSLVVGETVVAVGSPLGLNATVTTGIVSAKNRPVQATGEGGGEASLIDAVQTDAAINPGNSGGALVNMRGELVGIPTVIATLGQEGQSGSIGLGFAIPVNQAQRIAKQLMDGGKAQHAVIGAQVSRSDTAGGAEIAAINPGSPAEKAGLKKGDVVVKMDGRPIESGVALIAAVRSHQVGDVVNLVVRDGKNGPERNVSVTLGSE